MENSVEYTVAPKREGGSIAVSAVVTNSNLEIEVRDDGTGGDLSDIAAGHGLDLLQPRMQTIYEGAARHL